MGAESGDVPQKLVCFSNFFLDTVNIFAFSNLFKIKWPKSEDKLNFEGRWVWVPMHPSPPQSKLRGGALARAIVRARWTSHYGRYRRYGRVRYRMLSPSPLQEEVTLPSAALHGIVWVDRLLSRRCHLSASVNSWGLLSAGRPLTVGAFCPLTVR